MFLEVGTPAPEFTLRDTQGEEVSLSDLKGRKTLVVFIPFPFTGNCEAELCAIRDNLSDLNDLDANVVAITTTPLFSNRVWAEQNSFGFPVLSDFWPHGEVTAAYGAFDPAVGASWRVSFVLDEDGIVRKVIGAETRKVLREVDDYKAALAEIG